MASAMAREGCRASDGRAEGVAGARVGEQMGAPEAMLRLLFPPAKGDLAWEGTQASTAVDGGRPGMHPENRRCHQKNDRSSPRRLHFTMRNIHPP